MLSSMRKQQTPNIKIEYVKKRRAAGFRLGELLESNFGRHCLRLLRGNSLSKLLFQS